jgi:hypothetical protein
MNGLGGTAWNLPVRNMVYDASGLVWVAEQQPLLKTDSLTVTIGTPTVKISQSSTDNNVFVTNVLVPKNYDYIALTYTGSDLTKVEYYTGGSGGTKVATLTMTYSSNILQTVTRT